MSEIALIAKITARPGARADALAAFAPLLEQAEAEAGTTTYLVHLDADDDDVIWMYERYADADAHEAHRRSDVMKTAGRALGEHLAGPPEITRMTLHGGKGA